LDGLTCAKVLRERGAEVAAVVVATDAPTAGALTGEALPEGIVGEVCTRLTSLEVERRYS
jgi:hypothetical protein